MDERRKFTRIVFAAKAKLFLAGESWDVDLLDLSFKGALVKKKAPLELCEHQVYHLGFTLDGSDLNLVMSVQLAHIDGDKIGLRCKYMDIETISHLRRLIELNLGDDTLLHREMDILSHDSEDDSAVT